MMKYMDSEPSTRLVKARVVGRMRPEHQEERVAIVIALFG
jgi:hypothetical protein